MNGMTSGVAAVANHDPEPYRLLGTSLHVDRMHAYGYMTEFQPRAEFDVPVSGILSAFRANIGAGWDASVWLVALDSYAVFGGFTTWDDADHPFHPIVRASDAERAHARRVLTRLAVTS